MMKYLLVFAAVLVLTACEKDNATENAAEDTSSAIETSGETMSTAIDEELPEVMDAGDATMADMAKMMGSTIDDAKSAVAELEQATMESDEDARMKMEQAKKLMAE
tara:strand:- start:135 stop:452 length:318 start_codon:yes stop_codon:yes gene_type:complete